MFRGCNSVKFVFAFLKKGIYSKRKEFAPIGSDLNGKNIHEQMLSFESRFQQDQL